MKKRDCLKKNLNELKMSAVSFVFDRDAYLNKCSLEEDSELDIVWKQAYDVEGEEADPTDSFPVVFQIFNPYRFNALVMYEDKNQYFRGYSLPSIIEQIQEYSFDFFDRPVSEWLNGSGLYNLNGKFLRVYIAFPKEQE